ncbi:MAG: hypothetical protein AAF447_08480 [Myxococcota bacterium]
MAFPDGWQFKAPITVTGSRVVGGPHADLPVLLTADVLPADMLDLDGALPCQVDGGDVRFSSDPEGLIPLPADLRHIALNNDPAASTCDVVVRWPSLQNGVDSTVYVWWRSSATETVPAVTDLVGRNAVYADESHRYAFDGSVVGSAPQFVDRTGNGGDASVSGPTPANGPTLLGDGGASFIAGGGGQGLFTPGASIDNASGNTGAVSLLFTPDAAAGEQNIVGGQDQSVTPAIVFSLGLTATGGLMEIFRTDFSTFEGLGFNSAPPASGTLQHRAVLFPGDGTMRSVVDGSQEQNQPFTQSVNLDAAGQFGDTFATAYRFDELIIRGTEQGQSKFTIDWLATESAMWLDIAASFAAGAPEAAAVSAQVTLDGVGEATTAVLFEEPHPVAFQLVTAADVGGSLNSTHLLFGDGVAAFHAWFDVASGGTDPAPAGSTAVEVDIAAGATAAAVATALASAIDALPAFTATADGAIVTVTGSTLGTPDTLPADVDTAFVLTLLQQGGTSSALIVREEYTTGAAPTLTYQVARARLARLKLFSREAKTVSFTLRINANGVEVPAGALQAADAVYDDPPGGDVSFVQGWLEGASRTFRNQGANQVLLAIVALRGDAAGTSPTGLTYGGQAMTLLVASQTTSGGERVAVALYALNEAGITAATGTAFVVSTTGTPTEEVVLSAVVENAAQTGFAAATDTAESASGGAIGGSGLPLVAGEEGVIAYAAAELAATTFAAGAQVKRIDVAGSGMQVAVATTGQGVTPSVTSAPSAPAALAAVALAEVA